MTADIIQDARDVLAKWRAHQFDTAWEVDTNTPFSADLVGLFAPQRKEYAVKFDDDRQPDRAVARLIVGTAGNPELLDAIDGLLWRGTFNDGSSGTYYAERVAETIIAADERMSR